MPHAYYNEIDPFCAQWLRNLISAGHIARGDVDERSIVDVRPDDLRGYRQCHFFAGLGAWSHAMRLAGWPDDRPVWTGSPPCQPFSVAGKRAGKDDDRHLAPHFIELVRACRPAVLFGEQVASADVLGKVQKPNGRGHDGTPEWAWFDDLSERLEEAQYAVWARDIPASLVGAPHIRQRLWFVAERVADAAFSRKRAFDGEPGSGIRREIPAGGHDIPLGVAAAGGARLAQRERDGEVQRNQVGAPQGETIERVGDTVRLAYADGGKSGEAGAIQSSGQHGLESQDRGIGDARRPGPTDGFWRDADWLFCRDGKWRPVEPGTFPLAHGAPARVGRLRAYGNAIVAQVAAEVILAYLHVIDGSRYADGQS